MKRHVALEPFSRDHNDVLILARALESGSPEAVTKLRALWASELRDHFEQEEVLLIPLASPEMADRLTNDHRQIAGKVPALPEGAEALGKALTDHIRWEERTFFPSIEASASEEQLKRLQAETDALERRRWKSDERRRLLVERRWSRQRSRAPRK